MARERAQKEQRLRARRALWGALGAVAMAALALTSGLLSDKPVPVQVIAEVSHTGPMSVTFADELGETTSPACGCFRESPPGGWQGVVLPARELKLARNDDGRPTQFDIFNPGPQQWESLPNSHGLRVSVGQVELPTSVHPDTEAIQRALKTQSTDFETQTVDVLSVLSRGVLSVASLGRAPVAALGVPSGEPMSVKFQDDGFGGDDASVELEAPILATGKRSGDETNNLPLLDVLGPNVLLWAPTYTNPMYVSAVWMDPLEEFTIGEAIYQQGLSGFDYTEAHSESAGVSSGHRLYTVAVVDQGAFNVRVVARPGEADKWTVLDDIREEPGTVRVTVPQAASQAEKLARVFAAANRHPRSTIDRIPFIPEAGATPERSMSMGANALYRFGEQQFELPPTPPEAGINLFGRVKSLHLAETEGEFTIGTTPQSFGAKTPLEFRNFTSSRSEGERLLVPVQVDASSANFQFAGSAETRVNGQPVATAPSLFKRAIGPDVVGLVATLIGLALAAKALLEARRIRSLSGGT